MIKEQKKTQTNKKNTNIKKKTICSRINTKR